MSTLTWKRESDIYVRRDVDGKDRGQVWADFTLPRGEQWRYTGLSPAELGVGTMREARELCVDPRSQLHPNYGPSVDAEERIRRAGLTIDVYGRAGIYVRTLRAGQLGPFSSAAEAISNPIIAAETREPMRHEPPPFEPADVAVVEDIYRTQAQASVHVDTVLPYEALRVAAKLLRYAFASDGDYRASFHMADTPYVDEAGETDLSALAGLVDQIGQAGGFPA